MPIGWLAWLLPNEQRRIAAINLNECFPEHSRTQQRRLLRQTLVENAKTALELGPLWLRPAPQMLTTVREVHGEQAWQAALQRGRGALILTPHLGAWEIAGLYVSQHYPLTALYRPSRLGGAIDELIKTARERAGGRCVPTSTLGVRGVYRALARQQVVGILPDQDPGQEGGVFAPFFGRAALTMVLASKLAQRYRPPVFLIFAERLAYARGYRLWFRELPAVISADDLQTSVAALNSAVEQAIRSRPEQYLWSYKRFKSSPPGTAKLYRRKKRNALPSHAKSLDS